VWGIELIVVLVMIGFNAVFAGYEIALASVSKARLELLAREHRPGAKASLEMKLAIERSLAVLQLAITLCGAIAAGTGGAGAGEDLAPYLRPLLRDAGIPQFLASPLAVLLVVIPITALSVMFGELVPKVFALRNSEWVCLKLSPAMRWAAKVGSPVVWVFERSVTQIMRWPAKRRSARKPASFLNCARWPRWRAPAS
jgi:putative hemolysin